MAQVLFSVPVAMSRDETLSKIIKSLPNGRFLVCGVDTVGELSELSEAYTFLFFQVDEFPRNGIARDLTVERRAKRFVVTEALETEINLSVEAGLRSKSFPSFGSFFDSIADGLIDLGESEAVPEIETIPAVEGTPYIPAVPAYRRLEVTATSWIMNGNFVSDWIVADWGETNFNGFSFNDVPSLILSNLPAGSSYLGGEFEEAYNDEWGSLIDGTWARWRFKVPDVNYPGVLTPDGHQPAILVPEVPAVEATDGTQEIPGKPAIPPGPANAVFLDQTAGGFLRMVRIGELPEGDPVGIIEPDPSEVPQFF